MNGGPASAGTIKCTGTMFESSPEVLFEMYTIDEIEKLSQCLKQDIDKKREELRCKVGEKYRELLDAADTISQMTCSSQLIIDSVLDVGSYSNRYLSRSSCSVEVAMQGLPDAAVKGESEEQPIDTNLVALVAQIKLLMDSPEKIWTAVEAGEYLVASQLYLFARHVHTNLSLLEGSESFCSTFPVIERQWAAVAHFLDAILKGCEQCLISHHGHQMPVTEAMASMVLLRGLSVPSVFHEFLLLKRNWLQQVLEHKHLPAKEVIHLTLQVIVSFFCTVSASFVNPAVDGPPDRNGLEELLLRVCYTPAIQVFHSSGITSAHSLVMKFLPSIIREFQPRLVQPEDGRSPSADRGRNTGLDAEQVRNECTKWLDQVHELVVAKTSAVLMDVHTIPGLTLIKNGAFHMMVGQISDPEAWDVQVSAILGKSLHLWDEFFRNIFLDRIEVLVGQEAERSFQSLMTAIGTWNQGKEMDAMTQSAWSDTVPTDLPAMKAALKMKSHLFSPTVQDVCSNLDEALQTLLHSLLQYLSSSDQELHQAAGGCSPSDDRVAVLSALQQSLISAVHKLIQHFVDQPSQVDPILLGRLYQAMTELCPALKSCLESNSLKGFQAAPAPSEWNLVKTLLLDEADRLFLAAIERSAADLKGQVCAWLCQSAQEEHYAFRVTSYWDTIRICEETDEGHPVQSTIKVPQFVSVDLYGILVRCVRHALSQLGLHAISGKLHFHMSQKFAEELLLSYQEFLATSAAANLGQTMALQFYFDVQFIQMSLVSREKKALDEACAEALKHLERHIDPFDLSVFGPYISTNMRRFFLDHQSILSAIIPCDRMAMTASIKASLKDTGKLNVGEGAGTDGLAKKHNVIGMAPTVTGFALLPVIKTVTKSRSEATKPPPAKVLPVQGQSAVKKRDKSPVALAAGNFIEVMSSTWFGSK